MGISEVTEALKGLFSSKRIVAEQDAAPYGSYTGRNIKLENAREEFRKIKEEEELKFLEQENEKHRKAQRSHFWTDNGGLFPSAQHPERNMISIRKERTQQRKPGALSIKTNLLGSGGTI